jgi:hypothetical protein
MQTYIFRMVELEVDSGRYGTQSDQDSTLSYKGYLYPTPCNSWHKPWLNRFALSGGGDQGGFGEKPTHPKPPKELIQLGFLGRIRRVEQSPKSATMVVDKESSDRGKRHHDSSSVGHIQDKGLQEDQGAWTLEVFQE